jgi:hypothetical protein
VSTWIELSGNQTGEGLIEVSVQPPSDKPNRDQCTESPTCVELEATSGDPAVTLRWQPEEPEEDPGALNVVSTRADESVVVSYYGPTITGDPREMDLPISVDVLVAIAQDDRLALMVPPQILALGQDVPGWSSPPDAGIHKRVPQTDLGQAVAWILADGDLDTFREPQPSIYRSLFKSPHVGARVERHLHYRTEGELDILAAAQMPEWLTAGALCQSPDFDGCRELGTGERGPVVALWRLADGDKTGEVWFVQERPDEVIAVRYEGIAITGESDIDRVVRDYQPLHNIDSDLLGMTTEQLVLDFGIQNLSG